MPLDHDHSDEALRRRMGVLNTELRALRHARRSVASGAIIHRLDTRITAITTALYLVDTATINHRPETIPLLLMIAEEGLREARILIYQAARGRKRSA